jgi:hypothetical protein
VAQVKVAPMREEAVRLPAFTGTCSRAHPVLRTAKKALRTSKLYTRKQPVCCGFIVCTCSHADPRKISGALQTPQHLVGVLKGLAAHIHRAFTNKRCCALCVLNGLAGGVLTMPRGRSCSGPQGDPLPMLTWRSSCLVCCRAARDACSFQVNVQSAVWLSAYLAAVKLTSAH